MTGTTFEQIWGELEGGGKRYSIKLDLMIKELFANESAEPVSRVIAKMQLSRNEVPNGNYTLRYTFDGTRVEKAMRVEQGTLLAGSH